MRRFEIICGLSGLLFAGCASLADPDRYTQTGDVQKPRPSDCKYQFLSLVPSRSYDEIGIIDANRHQTRDTTVVMDGIRPQVCSHGGDAVIAEKAVNGVYIKAVVIKFKK